MQPGFKPDARSRDKAPSTIYYHKSTQRILVPYTVSRGMQYQHIYVGYQLKRKYCSAPLTNPA